MLNDLLKVLDMSEDEQVSWLCNYIYHHEKSADYWHNFLNRHISLADLAFRLRDEAVEQNLTMWQRAMDTVFLKTNEEHWKEEHQFARWTAVIFWFSHKAKPIHWIVAALIAKEQK